MNILSHHITVSKQAKYATYGNLSANTKYLWFVLHGSHMVCEQMIYKFAEFDPETHFVVAPEGLSRQYVKGYGGDTVASWMTSRDRQFEIEDFSSYLTQLDLLISEQLPPNCKKIALGFSQGGTTLFRWLHHSMINVDFLIAYSCSLPEDIDLKKSKTNLKHIPITYTYGTDDSFITVAFIKTLKLLVATNQLDVKMLPYKGIHRIDKQHLENIFYKLVKNK